MNCDVIIVGAGMTGASAARVLADSGIKVGLIEKRKHTGGNCHDKLDANGLLIHPYGPHIFHTSNTEAANFLTRFTKWTPYEHRVCALVRNRIIPLPFNLTSLGICFCEKDARTMTDTLLKCFGQNAQVPVLELRRAKESCLRDLSAFIYEEIFLGYTQKQWGLAPEDIDPAVTARVPVRVNHDERYFTDSFQYMPQEGFAVMFARMLDHPGISLRLGADFADCGAREKDGVCIYTGAIDALFGYKLGALPYRSLHFEYEHYGQTRHLPSAVLNYPAANIAWTRITEYKQLTGQKHSGTTVSLEYPLPHETGKNIPYYPVMTDAAAELHAAYREHARQNMPRCVFAGRLGAFCYLNMDQAVLAGIRAAEEAKKLLRSAE